MPKVVTNKVKAPKAKVSESLAEYYKAIELAEANGTSHPAHDAHLPKVWNGIKWVVAE